VKRRSAGVLVTMGALLMTLTGCTIGLVEGLVAGGVVAGGAATGLYLSGERDTLGAPLEQVYEAADLALQEIGDGIVEAQADASHATLSSRFKDGARISVKLKAVSSSATKTKVWVGLFGDTPRSKVVLQKIREKLRTVKESRDAAITPPRGP